AEVDRALRHDRAREIDVELVRDRLVLWLKTVNPYRFEAAFPFRRELPFDRASPRVQRVEFSIVACGVNHSIRHRRGAGDRPARAPLPNLPAALRIHRLT